MNRRRMISIALATGLGGAGLAGLYKARPAGAHRRRRWRHDVAQAFCGDRFAGHIEDAIAHIEVEMDFTDPQRAAWQRLAATVRAEAPRLEALCAHRHGAEDEARTLPDRLAVAEEALAAGLDFVRAVRPEMEAFHVTLDAARRVRLERMIRWRHG